MRAALAFFAMNDFEERYLFVPIPTFLWEFPLTDLLTQPVDFIKCVAGFILVIPQLPAVCRCAGKLFGELVDGAALVVIF
jgi:hypothetical protein